MFLSIISTPSTNESKFFDSFVESIALSKLSTLSNTFSIISSDAYFLNSANSFSFLLEKF